ncbi:hypothetical protein A1O3_03782 [Capronia epimyces CBS 606.96]|uniref:Methyltransferase domain-containing protein n=1 Tax=Capronia epimyces CBS 606.96 TaxID=1182542 RepID=W9Y2X0_9EURO|nr:uncharacterized protein A1O3_03782 [Capronia epimyces CBS 606.96]EXJ86828.1 hypothetical protein A1O3_03782 [Capronia epimyces CBS 606.96]
MSSTPPNLLASSKHTTPIHLYQPTLKAVPSAISALLAEYSGIAPAEQKEHITTVRDRAYASYPYPCLGRWRFLELDLASHPLYGSEILPALANTNTAHDSNDDTNNDTNDGNDNDNDIDDDWIFLDLGCCLGQDLRKLIYDGADVRRLYGADLNPEFIDIGYTLFGDQDRFSRNAHFIAPADVFDFSETSELSRRCDGRVAILHCTAVFHLFGLDEQKVLARRCLRLLKSRSKWRTTASASAAIPTQNQNHPRRALILGAQTANVRAGDYPRSRSGRMRYRHNEHSWRQFWEEAVAEDGWRDRIASVDVQSVLVERTFGDSDGKGGGGGADADAGADAGGADAEPNNTQAQIGKVEEGFRWMKWWVWIDFV